MHRKIALAASGLAATFALFLVPGAAHGQETSMASTAVAASTPVNVVLWSTVDAGTNIRYSPRLISGNIVGTTQVLTRIGIVCYSIGDYYNDGHYHTSIWYRGNIGNEGGPGWNQSYAWAGRVNTTSDPAPGVPKC